MDFSSLHNQVSLRSVGVFFTWTVTSFLCHYYAKNFLRGTINQHTLESSDVDNVTASVLWKGAANASIITAVQIGMCYVLVKVEASGTKWSLAVARMCHVIATWFTNISMACMFASSTFAIKLMEPITSAVVQFLVLGTPLSPLAILSLPFIVGGAIIFSGNPFVQGNLPFGIAAAFVSNLVLAFRNVALKLQMSGDNKTSSISPRPLSCPIIILVALSVIGFGLARFLDVITDRGLYLLICCFISGFFHVCYSYVSTGVVLSHLSVVSHAVANILKRVLVVLLLYICGNRSASPLNFAGLGVCTLGLMVYTCSKHQIRGSYESVQRFETGACLKNLLLITCSLFGGVCLATSVYDAPRLISSYPSFPATPNLNFRGVLNAPDRLFDRTFTSKAHELPDKNDLLPNLDGYLSEHKHDIEMFLGQDLLTSPNRSSFLSQKLRTRVEVVKEAQRLHFETMGKYLKKFKYAMLFDLAAFENKGDPCISVGEIYFLARIKLEIIYYCSTATCSKTAIAQAAANALNYSYEEMVILVHGGGNIVGYEFSDNQRFFIFEKFIGFQIFVFPQSVYIPDFNSRHFKLCQNKYCCNENVTFVMRDHQSYSYAKQYFSGTSRFILAPDMAFQIGPMQRFLSPVFDILWIKRQDNETPGYSTIPTPPAGVRMHVSDWWRWMTPPAPSSLEKAFYVCTNGFFYLQRGRVVITDRLHGHILSTLLDIPHVLIDNKEHKLSAYHSSWTAGLNNTYLTDDPVIALDIALQLLEEYKESLPPRVPFLNINENTGKTITFQEPDSSYT